MIRLQDTSKSFQQGALLQPVLYSINLHIQQGEHVMIVGANGSGKSTLLNLLAGNIYPDTGKIFLNETDVTAMPEYKRSNFIARVFQNPLAGTSPGLSILENMRLASLRTGSHQLIIGTGRDFRDRISNEIKRLGLGLEKDLLKPVGTLSGGQRQALTLIMAVMAPCKIILLDEPTAALDPRTSKMVTELADELITTFNLTAVHITHQLKDAVAFGNRLLMLKEGRIVKDIKGSDKLNLKTENLYEWFD